MSATYKKATKRRLSRDLISSAGLELVRRNGFDHLTMKALADELGVTPMALYRHVSNKSDLVNTVLDAFVREADVCSHDVAQSDWVAWLRATYSKMYHALKTMPSLYAYLNNAPRFGPNAMEVMARILSVLRAAGFNQTQAVNASGTLTGFIIGCALMDGAFHEELVDAENDTNKQSVIEAGFNHIFVGLEMELSGKKLPFEESVS